MIKWVFQGLSIQKHDWESENNEAIISILKNVQFLSVEKKELKQKIENETVLTSVYIIKLRS
jgi:hypothetical protein